MEKKRLILKLEFTNESGNIVPELSADHARPEVIMSALQFLAPGRRLSVSMEEVDFV